MKFKIECTDIEQNKIIASYEMDHNSFDECHTWALATIVQANDTEKFSLSIIDISSEYILSDRIQTLSRLGEPDDSYCKICLNVIRGYNKEKAFTTEQIIAMANSFSNIDYCLTKGMPKSSKNLITAMIPDEVIITSELKNLLLEILKGF
jgi:hypothetical protein